MIGSEVSGGCRNVFVDRCEMNSPNLERAIRIKTNSHRGGIIENLYVRNLTIGEVEEAVLKINCVYEINDGENGNHPPLVQNICLDNIRSEKSRYAIFLHGLEQQNSINNIFIHNSHFNGVDKGNFIEYAEIPVLKKVYINGNQVKL